MRNLDGFFYTLRGFSVLESYSRLVPTDFPPYAEFDSFCEKGRQARMESRFFGKSPYAALPQ